MRDFNPFGVKSIEVKFNCNNCGHEVISDEIGVPPPNYSADNHSDSIRDNDGYAICPNCGKEYEVYVYAGFGGGNVDIENIEDDDIFEIIEHDEDIYLQEPEEEIKPIYTRFRLICLEVKDWYVLKNFKIDFEDGINVLIGENGSGKSSVIECLALIFGHLYKFFVEEDKKAPYIKRYIISFESADAETGMLHTVQIDNCKNSEEGFNPIIYIGNKVIDIKNNRTLIKNLLPSKIGLYYAGITDRLQELSIHFENKYKDKIKKGDSAILYPLTLPDTRLFLYVKKEHLGVMLMCLLISENEEFIKCWKNEIGIDLSTSEIKLVLKKPSWANDSAEQLWGAHDLARKFITLLSENANRKSVSDNNIEITHSGIYLKDEFTRMFKNNIESKVFDIFDFLLFSDLLDTINITWKNRQEEYVELDHLSEGEKQLVTTMTFRLLWMNQKGFLLFDEPDTFLHPKWQQQFISNLSKIENNTQIIITTHSPNIVSNIEKKQLIILDSGEIKQFSFNPYGKTVENILIDHFSLQSTRNKEVQTAIDKVKLLIEKDEYDSPECIQIIEYLKKNIDSTDKDLLSINLEIAKKKHFSTHEKNK